MKTTRMILGLWFVAGCSLAIGSGCASMGPLSELPGMSKLPGMRKKMPEAKPNDPVVEIIGLWQPARGKGLDGMPTRGFAGQIMFFTRGQKSPVKVDGDVRVYVYDDLGTREEQAKPIRQFDFVDGTWNGYLYDVNMGPSYYVFIPYTRDGSLQANCSLRVRLKLKSGHTVYSDVANVALSGSPREEVAAALDQAANTMRRTGSVASAATAKRRVRRKGPLSESIGRVNGSGEMAPTERMRRLLADANVQPVSASVVTESPTLKLSRLKAVMEQTLDTQPADIEEPHRLAAAERRTTSRRFRLTPVANERNVLAPVLREKQQLGQPHPLADEWDFDSTRTTNSARPLRRRHPLEETSSFDSYEGSSRFNDGDTAADPFRASDRWTSDDSELESSRSW